MQARDLEIIVIFSEINGSSATFLCKYEYPGVGYGTAGVTDSLHLKKTEM